MLKLRACVFFKCWNVLKKETKVFKGSEDDIEKVNTFSVPNLLSSTPVSAGIGIILYHIQVLISKYFNISYNTKSFTWSSEYALLSLFDSFLAFSNLCLPNQQLSASLHLCSRWREGKQMLGWMSYWWRIFPCCNSCISLQIIFTS